MGRGAEGHASSLMKRILQRECQPPRPSHFRSLADLTEKFISSPPHPPSSGLREDITRACLEWIPHNSPIPEQADLRKKKSDQTLRTDQADVGAGRGLCDKTVGWMPTTSSALSTIQAHVLPPRLGHHLLTTSPRLTLPREYSLVCFSASKRARPQPTPCGSHGINGTSSPDSSVSQHHEQKLLHWGI